MKCRWTKKELEETSTLLFGACIIAERMNSLNPNTPLYQKLKETHALLMQLDMEDKNKEFATKNCADTAPIEDDKIGSNADAT